MPGVEDAEREEVGSPDRGAKASTSGAVDVVVVPRHEEDVSPNAAEKAAAIKKGFLPANESEQDLCRYEGDLTRLLEGTFDHPLPPARGIRNLLVSSLLAAGVCQQETEEDLLVLGCRCRGELSKAHRTCINAWFQTIGSNRCEICQQVASNVPFPQSQPTVNYWVWRVNPAPDYGQRERGCFTPAWVAVSILIGGLLLDVLISVSLGVSAVPVNIIVGIAIVLGLGTAIRLMLECCHEWNLRRNHPQPDNADPAVSGGYAPTV